MIMLLFEHVESSINNWWLIPSELVIYLFIYLFKIVLLFVDCVDGVWHLFCVIWAQDAEKRISNIADKVYSASFESLALR